MKRRDFIRLLGGCAAGSLVLRSHSALAQQKRRIAALMGGLVEGDPEGQSERDAFEAGLKALGWKAGGNLDIVYHWPGAELEPVRAAAAEIAGAKPDLVLSRSTPATAAIQNSGLPIVFALVADPLGSGFVDSLGKPGGKLTGFSNFEQSVGSKWFELLREAAPQVAKVGLLFNPATAPSAQGYLTAAQNAAQSVGATVIAAPCASIADMEAAFAARGRDGGGSGGMIAIIDTFLLEHRDFIVTIATRYKVPTIYGTRAFIASGGLIAYAADYQDIFRRAASYVDRILKGAHPGDLPVQEPTKYVLSVNLKAASAIGLTLPQRLTAQADEVIE